MNKDYKYQVELNRLLNERIDMANKSRELFNQIWKLKCEKLKADQYHSKVDKSIMRMVAEFNGKTLIK